MDLTTEPFMVGKWTVYPLAGELCQGDITVEIEPKLVHVLWVLAAHAPDLVTRDYLIEQVWGQHYIGESPLANAVSRIRNALGDSSSNPSFIKTEHGKGYRLICEVALDLGAQRAHQPNTTPREATVDSPTGEQGQGAPRRFGINVPGMLTLAVLLALIVTASVWWRGRAPEGPVTVAVVPFENVKGADDQLLGRAVARDVLAQLSGVPELAVISDSVSFPQLNTGIDVVGVGEKIGADYVIDGTIDTQAGRVTVSVEVINTRKNAKKRGLLLESDDFSVRVGAVNQLGPRIAKAIAGWLGAGTTDRHTVPIREPDTLSAEASRLYYAGLEFLKRTNEASNLRRAIAMFEDALDEDRRYAGALAGSCEAHLRLYIVNREESLYDTATDRCNRALLLQPELTQAKVSIGTLYREAGKLEESRLALEAVRALQPDHVKALIELADTLADLDRHEEAEATLREAVALQPGNWESYSALGNFLYSRGHYEEALQHFDWVTELMPASAIAHANVGSAHHALGRTDEAKVALDRSIALEPVGFALLSRGIIAYYEGDYARAADAYEEAIAHGEEDYWVWGLLAEASRFVDQRADTVRKHLNTAVALAQQRIAIKSTDSFALAQLGLFQARLGNFDTARECIERARRQSPEDMDISQIEAAVWAEQGDAQQVCANLREAVALGFDPALIHSDPDFRQYLAADASQDAPCL